MPDGSGISTIDASIVIAYLVGITGIGIYASHSRRANLSDYFLAGRSLRWPIVGAALFATNISTIHLVGLAAGGYDLGLVIGNFEWMAVFTLILLGLVFAPLYIRSRISTLPEYVERRYSPGTRTAVAFVGVASALFIHIGISLYAGAAVIEQFFEIPALTSIIIISMLTVSYTAIGGLKAVVVTETFQTALLLIGAILITALGLLALPDQGIHSLRDFQAELKPDQFNMMHSLRNGEGRLNEFSWLAILLGYPVLGIWYWCTDQTIVQRVLGAKSEKDAQFGALFAGVLKILPVFLMVFPGIIGYVLFRNLIGDDANETLPVMIAELVPEGIRGLIVAGMLAALMSTISGALHSCATLVSVDIVKRLRPGTSDRRVVQFGRISAIVIMVLAMLWSTQGGKFTSIFEAINKIPVAFAPPISVIFLWGALWARGTRQAAISTVVVGFSLGLFVLAIDLPLFGTTRIITDTFGIPFMLQTAILFGLYSILFVFVSLLTPAPGHTEIGEVCWRSPREIFAVNRKLGLRDPIVLGAGLFLLLIALYFAV